MGIIIPLGDCKRHTPIREWDEGRKEWKGDGVLGEKD